MEITRQEAIMRSHSWWFCENIINHSGQVGLLRLDFPRVFILIKDYEIAYWASYEAFKNDIIELNFLDPADREGADIDEIVTDAWNFLALTEEEEDRLAEEREDDY